MVDSLEIKNTLCKVFEKAEANGPDVQLNQHLYARVNANLKQ